MGPLEAGTRLSVAGTLRSEMIRLLITYSPCGAMAQQSAISGFDSAYVNFFI